MIPIFQVSSPLIRKRYRVDQSYFQDDVHIGQAYLQFLLYAQVLKVDEW